MRVPLRCGSPVPSPIRSRDEPAAGKTLLVTRDEERQEHSIRARRERLVAFVDVSFQAVGPYWRRTFMFVADMRAR